MILGIYIYKKCVTNRRTIADLNLQNEEAEANQGLVTGRVQADDLQPLSSGGANQLLSTSLNYGMPGNLSQSMANDLAATASKSAEDADRYGSFVVKPV